jgi:mutator protein MutT
LTERVSSVEERPAIHVAAAVLVDRHRRVLIAQRPAGKHHAGGWEFPGGKIERGESPRQALARELEEELGITIEHPRPLSRVRHAYPHGAVLLDVWVVRRYRGEPRGRDGQALRWCSQRELENAQLLPADQPIVTALHLPARLRSAAGPGYEIVACEELALAPPTKGPRRLRGCLCGDPAEALRFAGSADFLVMRDPLPHDALRRLCAGVERPVYARGLALERAWVIGATGVSWLAASL